VKEITISSVSEYVSYIETLKDLDDYWFRGVSNRKYLPTPGLIWRNETDDESALEHYFLLSYKSYVEETNLSEWEIFALMQHHGLPTRLLDWSESALVALFFALISEPKSTTYRAVWVLQPYELNRKTIGNNILYCPSIITDRDLVIDGKKTNIDAYLPPNLNPNIHGELPDKPMAIHSTQHLKRVSAQKGCFTVHGKNTDPINSYLENDDHFHMIKISARNKADRLSMLNTLAGLGIDEEFIYQDLDSLCDKIKRLRKIEL
jgi:hypothetical protein